MKLLVVIFFCSLNLFAQTKFYEKLKEQTGFIVECRNKAEKEQIEKFGRLIPTIAGQCEWGSNGCPVRLGKPNYPEVARKHKISGIVKVEIIIDETGKVVFAKAVRGKAVFYANTETAALHSRFHPLILCGKAVWQKRIIQYNFVQTQN